jgi:FkbM family methyltransferase
MRSGPRSGTRVCSPRRRIRDDWGRWSSLCWLQRRTPERRGLCVIQEPQHHVLYEVPIQAATTDRGAASEGLRVSSCSAFQVLEMAMMHSCPQLESQGRTADATCSFPPSGGVSLNDGAKMKRVQLWMVNLRTALIRLPPDSIRSLMKIGRARIFELMGSDRFSSPALNRLDDKVRPYLASQPGVFLEIGANDGYSQSNTYYLEKRLGWRGILIEPLPSRYRICKLGRRRSYCINACCVGPDGPDEVILVDLGLMSVAVGLQSADQERRRLLGREGRKFAVATTTLSTIIDASPFEAIDFMSVDVEGAELEVLTGVDWARHTPGILLVETSSPDDVDQIVGNNMRRVAALSHHDYLYLRANSPVSGQQGM